MGPHQDHSHLVTFHLHIPSKPFIAINSKFIQCQKPENQKSPHYFCTWWLFPLTTPIHLLNQKGCSIESDHPPPPNTANTAISSARDDPPHVLTWRGSTTPNDTPPRRCDEMTNSEDSFCWGWWGFSVAFGIFCIVSPADETLNGSVTFYPENT